MSADLPSVPSSRMPSSSTLLHPAVKPPRVPAQASPLVAYPSSPSLSHQPTSSAASSSPAMPRLFESSLASSSPLGLPNPRFREAPAHDAPRSSMASSSSSSDAGMRHPNRYAGLPAGRQTPAATEYSPKTVYPPTDYGSPVSSHAAVPPIPSRWLPQSSAASQAPPPPPPAPRRPPPLDFTELLVLQAQPRADIPVLSLTPSPRTAPSFHRDDDPFASSVRQANSQPGSRRRASPASFVDVAPTPIAANPPGGAERRQTGFSLAPVTAWISRLGLDDADKTRARKAVSREMRKLEGDRRELDQWDREREADEEREWIWRGVAPMPVAGAGDVGVVGAKDDLRPWSPLQIKKERDPWVLFRREKAGGGGAGASSKEERSGKGGPHGADIADAHMAQRKKRRRNLWILLAILILLLTAGLGVLLYKLLSKSSTATTSETETTATETVTSGSSTYVQTVTSTSTSTHATSSSGTATQSAAASATSSAAPVINLASCLADYPPSNATSYCSTCNAFLSTATNDWTTTSGGTAGVGEALQWCGLRALFEATTTNGALNWFAGNGNGTGDFCGWDGITCDDADKVIQLNMTYPGVPSTLPSAIGNLVSLQTLYVSGSTVDSVPSGSLPSTVYSLANLTSLSLVNTAISSAIPNTAFSSSSKLQSLVLVGNAGLGSSLPSGLAGIGLTSLIVQGQSLSGNPVGSLPNSLTYLDLSSNSLSSLSAISGLTSLTTLLASSNALTSLPDAFPSTLATLSLSQNTALSGQLPSDLCDSAALTKCDVADTQLKGNVNQSTTSGNTTTSTTSCGVCTF